MSKALHNNNYRIKKEAFPNGHNNKKSYVKCSLSFLSRSPCFLSLAWTWISLKSRLNVHTQTFKRSHLKLFKHMDFISSLYRWHWNRKWNLSSTASRSHKAHTPHTCLLESPQARCWISAVPLTSSYLILAKGLDSLSFEHSLWVWAYSKSPPISW